MNKNFGVYIHIPFCKSKCPYCDFYSSRGSEADFDDYTNLLVDKIAMWGNKLKRNVSGIYIGGGTPSLLGEKRLCKIIEATQNCFLPNDDCEITVEVNPESGKKMDFAMLKNYGINRISVGLQSSNKKELATLGRLHSADAARKTCENAIKGGIDNISLDLMMGIPHQSIDTLKKSIEFCRDCNVKHISSYILKIEEGTWFYNHQNKLVLPDDDLQAGMYLFAVDYLSKLGYKQYEISNFAVPGFESRHNINYWKCGEYIGIGPSAYSFVNCVRFHYSRNLSDFQNDDIISDGVGGDEEEFIMLSLRLTSGLNFSEYKKRYNRDFPSDLLKKINLYVKNGFMEISDDSIRFTPKGYLVSNTILSELI